jgi:tRNA threonylcarbamoyladenosine biosynthesis protein TsaE
VLLEGEMGAGKTTFARELLLGLGVTQPPEGSPTFAIAHEYHCERGGVVHIDLYRIRSESELDHAGIPEYFWSRPLIVICEWLSMWPEFESKVKAHGSSWQVAIAQVDGKPELRAVTIARS